MGQMTRALNLVTGPLIPPPDRGKLMTAEQVASEIFPRGTSPKYVHRHVYPRVPIGRRTFWYEADVRDWLEHQRTETA